MKINKEAGFLLFLILALVVPDERPVSRSETPRHARIESPRTIAGDLKDEMYAHQSGKSGKPRWMEPFSKVDVFGKPTVFSPNFRDNFK
jgi:hypothetical protein